MLTKVIARYGRIDLLCLDELGYIELDRRGAELLFQVFTEREEKSSIAIASNAAFSEWAAAFTDPRLCAAIVDRLTYDAHIITTGTGSYRLRATAARRQAAAKASRTQGERHPGHDADQPPRQLTADGPGLHRRGHRPRHRAHARRRPRRPDATSPAARRPQRPARPPPCSDDTDSPYDLQAPGRRASPRP